MAGVNGVGGGGESWMAAVAQAEGEMEDKDAAKLQQDANALNNGATDGGGLGGLVGGLAGGLTGGLLGGGSTSNANFVQQNQLQTDSFKMQQDANNANNLLSTIGKVVNTASQKDT